MKNKFTMVKRIIATLFIICTMVMMIIFFRDIHNIYTLGFVRFYLALIILMVFYFATKLYMKIGSLKYKKIIKA